MVALAEERLLVALYALIVQRVVHGNRDLRGHLVQEIQIGLIIGRLIQAPESEGAQPPLRGGKRDRAKGPHPLLAQYGGHLGETGLVLKVRDHQRPLRLPDPTAGRVVHG